MPGQIGTLMAMALKGLVVRSAGYVCVQRTTSTARVSIQLVAHGILYGVNRKSSRRYEQGRQAVTSLSRKRPRSVHYFAYMDRT